MFSSTSGVSGIEFVKSPVENREDKQSTGECVRRRCSASAADDSDYCAKHRDKQREYHRQYMARRRAEWKVGKLCGRCGLERLPRQKFCGRCLVAQGMTPQRVKSPVENRSSRIAARIIAWENSPTNAGRKRLRGGKRGRPSAESIETKDLEYAVRDLERGVAGLQFYRSDEVKQKPVIQREDIRLEALHRLAACRGWIAGVLEAHGFKVELGEEGEDDSDE